MPIFDGVCERLRNFCCVSIFFFDVRNASDICRINNIYLKVDVFSLYLMM